MAKLDEVFRLLQKNQLDQARPLLEEMLKRDPNNIDVLYNLGMCYTELGLPDKAVSILQKCVELKPDFSKCSGRVGICF